MLSNLLIKLQSNNLLYVTYKKSNSLVSHKKMLLKNCTHCQLKNICFENITIKRGSIILIGIDNDGFPLFADIFTSNTNVSLVLPLNFIVTVEYLFAVL